MDEHPLFMDHIPDDLSNYPELEALQQLAYEGPPEEVALNFKNQGNEQFKLGTPKCFHEAIKYYSQGLEEEFPDCELKATLYNNRAQAQFMLKNFGYAIADSESALRIQPSNLKA
jgi:tetratricopeptide (TPR) repeat protein